MSIPAVAQATRHAQIIATLGPSSCTLGTLQQMLEAGANVFRVNFSHPVSQALTEVIAKLRHYSAERKLDFKVLADLQGPKIRIGEFKDKAILLKTGDRFVLDTYRDQLGDQTRVSLDFPELITQVNKDDVLLLADGLIQLRVDEVIPASGNSRDMDGHEHPNGRIVCTVLNDGELKNRKGVNRQGGGLSATALTGEDVKHLRWALEHLLPDYVAISFPKNAHDMNLARGVLNKLLREQKDVLGVQLPMPQLVSKVERRDAVEEHLQELVAASDVVMVARGDLGVEIGYENVPAAQAKIIQASHRASKPVIVATEMMESMITQTRPTRAEVADVHLAVLQGADYVMLSAETASGKHPVDVLKAMDTTVKAAEEVLRQKYLDPVLAKVRRSSSDTLSTRSQSPSGSSSANLHAAISTMSLLPSGHSSGMSIATVPE